MCLILTCYKRKAKNKKTKNKTIPLFHAMQFYSLTTHFHFIADSVDSALLPYTSYRLSLMAGKCCPKDNTSPREAQSLLIQVALKT
jgi:hypothetical protein